MNYNQLVQTYKYQGLVLTKYGQVKEDKIYNLYKILINNNSKKTLTITTGFHGDEYNGPVSLLNISKEVIEYSKKKKVNLIIYICVNPSGFENHTMYNFSKENSNNDFIRYKKNGKLVSSLPNEEKPNNFKIIVPNAKESKLILKDILKAKKIPVGFIDIHQDDYISYGDFYTYIPDRREIYEKIMKQIDKIAVRSANATTMNYDDKGNEITETVDSEGFIDLRDTGLGDLFYCLGSEFAITIETNAKSQLRIVEKTNKIWIQSIIDLISKSKKLDSKLSYLNGSAPGSSR